MNNDIIKFLNNSLININGIGEQTFSCLKRLLPNTRIKDLLFHTPNSVIDRTYTPTIKEAENNKIATLKITILKHIPKIKGTKLSYKIIGFDGTDKISLVFFNSAPYLKTLLPIDSQKIISGKITIKNYEKFMYHPDYIADISSFNNIAILEPIYPLTYGITNKQIRFFISKILTSIPKFPEWQKNPKISFNEAINTIHNLDNNTKKQILAKTRLAYDEILAQQLSLQLFRNKTKTTNGIQINITNKFLTPFLNSIGFKLTNSQQTVWNEIKQDLSSIFPMNRLLQGDVGSGKTIIAFLSILSAVESDGQAVFMAPTEILATQHFENLHTLLIKANLNDKIQITLLTSKDKGTKKIGKLTSIQNGTIDIIIGTHSVIEDNVIFKNLYLAVIDEQHKFGVNQRLKLYNKNTLKNVNILTMTATPIPRTLALVNFGDMDISIIDELPPNRKQIKTFVLNINKLDELILSIQEKIKQDDCLKIYWVCPLIEESEKLKLSNVTTRYEYLHKIFKDKVELIHGKMKTDQKEKIIQEFTNKKGNIKILLTTTIIEVGVNIPEATIMIIENSERFGLSSLHQLRGRIGRSDKDSTCILLYDKLGVIAKSRLEIMKSTTDGFKIAEQDLQLRGAGDILGTQQSGIIDFKFIDIKNDYNLFLTAKKDAEYIIKNEKPNNTIRWQNLQILLNLFDYNFD